MATLGDFHAQEERRTLRGAVASCGTAFDPGKPDQPFSEPVYGRGSAMASGVETGGGSQPLGARGCCKAKAWDSVCTAGYLVGLFCVVSVRRRKRESRQRGLGWK